MVNTFTTMTDTFIKQYGVEPSVCDGLIEYFKTQNEYKGVGNFKSSESKFLPGITYDSYKKGIKDSTDCWCYWNSTDERIKNYIQHIEWCLKQYIQHFNLPDNMEITDQFNIQYYPPGGGYKQYHCERGSGQYKVVRRSLVFMTYLNDVRNGGETEFLYQEDKYKAKKGRTLLWPPDFTHTHRGIPAQEEEKYIATGWFQFI